MIRGSGRTARSHPRGSAEARSRIFAGTSRERAPCTRRRWTTSARWLLECTYLTDIALFRKVDHWQHPRTFEELRHGDCEDHALWAWRKLAELGIDAELVSGQRIVSVAESHDHVWVLFREGGVEYVLEAVSHTRETMVMPAADVRAAYRPHVGVNVRFETIVFGGLVLTMQEKRRQRSRRIDQQPSFG